MTVTREELIEKAAAAVDRASAAEDVARYELLAVAQGYLNVVDRFWVGEDVVFSTSDASDLLV